MRRILKSEADRLEKNQGIQIKKLHLFNTGELYAGRIFTVKQAHGMDGMLSIKHKAYQRFLDVKRKVRTGSGRLRTRQYSIHNRHVFGHYISISKRLMFDLTDDVVQGIKQDLNIVN